MITIGVSACLTGMKVRFDGGHKRSPFVTGELANYVEYRTLCPEMAIGLPSPRPTARLIATDRGTRMVDSVDHSIDYTDAMTDFCETILPQLGDLSGYIVCAKSPSCGMERVKVYRDNGYSLNSQGTGLFTQALMKRYPWLPVEEQGRLNDAQLRENFMLRVFTLHDWQTTVANNLSAKAIIRFHTRNKYLLLACNQKLYRQLGRQVASVQQHHLESFAKEYLETLMQALAKVATRKSHTNVLMHMQGYFKKYLSTPEKAELRTLIEQYNAGIMPLLAPITLLKHHLKQHPHPFLEQQSYFSPYPEQLRLRYGI